MCRNIRPLFNFEPPATEEEIRAAALQFVRKVSGFAKPSKANAETFDRAVEEVADAARKLVFSLQSAAPPRDREAEAIRARERAARRLRLSPVGRAPEPVERRASCRTPHGARRGRGGVYDPPYSQRPCLPA